MSFVRNPAGTFLFPIFTRKESKQKVLERNQNNNITFIRNPGRDISFPIFIRKEIEIRALERKSKQNISRSIDLLYR